MTHPLPSEPDLAARKAFDAMAEQASAEMQADYAARYVDLRYAVELADTRTWPVEEKDGMVEVYAIKASDWNRVVAVARGSVSQKARRSLDRFRERVTAAANRAAPPAVGLYEGDPDDLIGEQP